MAPDPRGVDFNPPINTKTYKGPPLYGDPIGMTEPKGVSVKSLARRTLVFLSAPMVLVLTSVFMTILSFMSMKAKEGETWSTLMGWWWHLMVQDPLTTIAFPVCIALIFIIVNPWSK